MREMRVPVWSAAAAAASLVLAGCLGAAPSSRASTPVPASAAPGASQAAGRPQPSPTTGPANGPTPPPGDAVRIDRALLDETGLAVTLEFVGGKDYSPADPCSSHYFGWAREIDGMLQAKVVNDTPTFPSQGGDVMCDAVGYGRRIAIYLPKPYGGTRLRDLAGVDHFVRPPDGLVKLRVPSGWTQDIGQEEPLDHQTLWFRAWTREGADAANGTGLLQLHQAFSAPADIVDATGGRAVKVKGASATLYRNASSGELVVTWMLGRDGLALVANEGDFTANQLIDLAASATRP
jgi:hypothetical protein